MAKATPQEKIDEMAELFMKGYRLTEIKKKTGVGNPRQALTNAGVYDWLVVSRRVKAYRLYQAGWKFKRIGEKMGISSRRAETLVRKGMMYDI